MWGCRQPAASVLLAIVRNKVYAETKEPGVFSLQKNQRPNLDTKPFKYIHLVLCRNLLQHAAKEHVTRNPVDSYGKLKGF